MTQSLSRVVPTPHQLSRDPETRIEFVAARLGLKTDDLTNMLSAFGLSISPAPDPDTLSEAVGLLRRLFETSDAVRTKLATVKAVQNRDEFDPVSIPFVNSINAARAFLDANTPEVGK